MNYKEKYNMDYKKKYEDALDNFKKIKEANKSNKELVYFIEYKYPELKDSEDERIRKNIVDFLSRQGASIKYDFAGWIAWLEKQLEQKPAWSEEDEWKFSDILALLRGGENYHYNTPKLFAWLKSIKDRVQPQPKQECSEEDKKKIMWLVRLISTAGFRELDNDKIPCSRSELIDWLKSLIPQNTWKPSDEMLEALYRVTPENVMEKSEDEMLLDKLYQGLKYGRVLSKE